MTGCRSKWRDRLLDVGRRRNAEVAADALADQDPLDRDVGDGAGQGVGRHLPPSDAEPVGEVVEGVAGVRSLGIRQATDGIPVCGSESQSSSKGPSFTISAARNCPVS